MICLAFKEIYLWYVFDIEGHLECIRGDRKGEEETEGE